MKRINTLNSRALRRGVVALLLLVTSVAANAYDFEAVNSDGVTIYYNKSGSTASVTYGGTSSSSALYSGDVVVPETVNYDGTTYAVTEIGLYAFYRCTGLTSVTIPESVTSIGRDAFYYCSGLTSVTIGNSVRSIGGWAFCYCLGLTQFEVAEGNECYCAVDGVLFTKDMTTLIQFPAASTMTSYDIPENVTEIEIYAFNSCTGLTSVTIGSNVTSIGSHAFYRCSGLTGELIIPESVKEMGSYAFFECSGLTSVTIGNSVTEISDWAFELCKGLTSVTIGESVTEIGYMAFESCSSLTSVTIPNSVTEIGDNAFAYCTGLTSVTIPESVTEIGSSAFRVCTRLTSVTIPEGVTSIGEQAFRDCSGLTSIYSLNPEPPTCGSNSFGYGVFYNVDKSSCTLYVPEGTKDAYSTAYAWKDFRNIIANQPNAIDDIVDSNGNADVLGYYTTDGKQVPTLQRGINIVRYSDGTAKKVLVK